MFMTLLQLAIYFTSNTIITGLQMAKVGKFIICILEIGAPQITNERMSWWKNYTFHHHHQSSFDPVLSPLTRVAGFTPLCQQSLPLPFSISFDSLHPPSSNQHSYSPSPLVISMSSSVVLASSFPSLQSPMPSSKHGHHPSLTHARTISLPSSKICEWSLMY